MSRTISLDFNILATGVFQISETQISSLTTPFSTMENTTQNFQNFNNDNLVLRNVPLDRRLYMISTQQLMINSSTHVSLDQFEYHIW
ncbi:unnamed protein product [Ambrosiozyma monospora]|uniref:Unnamed protein product n=1 Tax=Ambrosiozyma monospora TaxID=43982 RepID=A0ACB5T8G5_AMBMO|nr:unnamed protein product [Ambrosiozyma monospora]